MRYFILAICVVNTCSAQFIDFASSYSLMLQNNEEYQSGVANLKAAGYDVASERSNLFPQLNITSEYGLIGEYNRSYEDDDEVYTPFETSSSDEPLLLSGFDLDGVDVPRQGDFESGQTSLVFEQSLFDLEKVSSLNRVKSERRVAEINLLLMQDSLTVRLLDAYLGVLSAQDSLEITEKELDELREHKKLTQDRHDERLGSLTDVYEAESRYQQVFADYATAEAEVSRFKTELKLILNHNVDEVAPLVAEPGRMLFDEGLSSSVKDILDVQLAEQELKTVEYSVKQQKAVFWPKIGVRAERQYSATTSSPVSSEQKNYSNQVMLQLEMPLFASFGNYARAKGESYRLEAEKAEYRNSVSLAEKKLQDTLLDYQTSYSRLVALEKAHEATKKGLDLRVEGYLEGLSSNLDLLDSYRDTFSSERRWREALYEYIGNRFKYLASSRHLTRQDIDEVNLLFSDNL